MTNLDSILFDLLVHHNCVIIPEFGGFIAKRVSSQIDFEKGREFNFASIEYDPLNCDARSLSSVVNAIADGKLYGVKSIEVTHFAPAAAPTLE